MENRMNQTEKFSIYADQVSLHKKRQSCICTHSLIFLHDKHQCLHFCELFCLIRLVLQMHGYENLLQQMPYRYINIIWSSSYSTNVLHCSLDIFVNYYHYHQTCYEYLGDSLRTYHLGLGKEVLNFILYLCSFIKFFQTRTEPLTIYKDKMISYYY